MKIQPLSVLLAFAIVVPAFRRGDIGIHQAASRVWGRPACGVRASIAVEKTRVSKGSPFVVSVMIENTSDKKIDLKVIPAFKLGNSARTASESAVTFGEYWCPVNLEEKNAASKTGMILGSPSHLAMEKGTSIDASMDLARHGWDKITSSWWPALGFDKVVGSGRYRLRLDIQVNGSAEPQWIRSNEIEITIGDAGEADRA